MPAAHRDPTSRKKAAYVVGVVDGDLVDGFTPTDAHPFGLTTCKLVTSTVLLSESRMATPVNVPSEFFTEEPLFFVAIFIPAITGRW